MNILLNIQPTVHSMSPLDFSLEELKDEYKHLVVMTRISILKSPLITEISTKKKSQCRLVFMVHFLSMSLFNCLCDHGVEKFMVNLPLITAYGSAHGQRI